MKIADLAQKACLIGIPQMDFPLLGIAALRIADLDQMPWFLGIIQMSSDDSLQLRLDGMGYSQQAHDLKEGEHLVGSPTKLLSVCQIP